MSSSLETEAGSVIGKRESNRARRSADLGSAGLEAFLDGGYAGASVEKIAAAAGVARGTFYLYHSNKEALFCDLLDRLSVPLLAAIEHARDSIRQSGSVEEAQSVYSRLGAEIATVLSGRLPLVRLMLAEARSAGPGGEAVRERLRRAEGLAREILEEGTRRGLHRPHDHRTASLAITGAVERLAWAVVSGEIEADPTAAAIELVEMFRRALAPS